MKRPWDAVVWWEIRRVPFNLVILAAGIVSAFVIAFVGSRVFGADQDIGSPFMEAAFYAIAANLCYTLGWITSFFGLGAIRHRQRLYARKFFGLA